MKSKHLSNFIYIIFIQCGNYIFPLITLPLVSRIFGPSLIGEYNYASYIIGYLCLLISYSFNYTGVRRLTRDKDNKNKIFWTIFYAQVLLFLIVSIPFAFYIHYSNSNHYLLLMCFLSCIATVFQQNWIFQVYQDFRVITIISVITKIMIMASIFLLINDKGDLVLYAAILQGGLLLSSIVCFIISIHKYHIKFVLVPINELFIFLRVDMYVFIINILGNLYTSTGVVLLGYFTNSHEVGIYTSAQKVIELVRNFTLIPLNMLLFPLLSESFGRSKESGIALVRRLMPLFFIFSVISFLGILIFGKVIILTVFGNQFAESIDVLYMLSLGFIFVFFGYLIGGQVILNLNFDKKFVNMQLVIAIISLALNSLILPKGGYLTTALVWTVSEFLMTLSQLVFLHYNKINIIDLNAFKKENILSEISQIINRKGAEC